MILINLPIKYLKSFVEDKKSDKFKCFSMLGKGVVVIDSNVGLDYIGTIILDNDITCTVTVIKKNLLNKMSYTVVEYVNGIEYWDNTYSSVRDAFDYDMDMATLYDIEQDEYSNVKTIDLMTITATSTDYDKE